MDSHTTEKRRGSYLRVLFKNGRLPVEGFLWNCDPLTGTLILIQPLTPNTDEVEDTHYRFYGIMSDAIQTIEPDESMSPLNQQSLAEYDSLLTS
ncbi:Glycerophosphoryl diester phosphodiesterase [Schizosaccharomyces pombe]|uniref:Uncharacterized protein new12 n=1 Tax=Schizosaccharomyces pombe (strain 972 / ATCC 24843) TaxID=284812 RepID=GEMI6_SCHPO|nr:protein new12 [Schizosaccharomyces pombe]G2TRK8.1 RecName: Full=Uncharacterized protein new12 [Schizosaccharomyces pombe 972h-]CCD31345.1 sequence orphan [Schizosaccharomyces pombe]|eukprot:NP_001343135.1 protein new12 [Schizosaccharomyces pombe]